MLIFATEMMKKSVTTYFVQDCPDFLPFVFVNLFLSNQRQKKTLVIDTN